MRKIIKNDWVVAAALFAMFGAAMVSPAQALSVSKNGPVECQVLQHSTVVINLTASGQEIAGVSGAKVHICSIDLVTSTALNIALVEGSGTVCATSPLGMAGGNTAASGWRFAANAIFIKGDGSQDIFTSTVNGNSVCLLSSGTGLFSGSIQYVIQ